MEPEAVQHTTRQARLNRVGLAGRPLTVAVLGTGSAGAQHLTVLQTIEGVRPVAVPIRPSRSAEWTAQGMATAPSLAEAVRYGATLGVIATNTGRHAADAIQALELGVDLLVEKPLATDAAEAWPVCQRAAGLARQLFVGCTLRFSESLLTFREHLPRVGRLHAVRIECQSSLPRWRPARPYQQSYSARLDEGGVLRDLIHEIDYAGWLFGWPSAVQARVRNLGRLGIESEEIAEVTWETESGCLVSVCLDYLSHPPRRRMRACGGEGTLEWDGLAGTTRLMQDGMPVESFQSSQTRDEMLLAQTLGFIHVCAGGSEWRLATGEDGLRALAVCDAARRAAESHREEPVIDLCITRLTCWP